METATHARSQDTPAAAASRSLAASAWSPRWLKRRPRALRIALRSACLLLLALFSIWLILFVTKGRFLKQPFEDIASSLTQRDVKVGGDFNLYFAPLNVRFLAEDMTVSNPGWAKNKTFFSARMIDAHIRALPLLWGKREVQWLALDKGAIDLEWDRNDARNTWTFGDPDGSGKSMTMPVINRGIITGSHVAYRDPRLRLTADIDVDTVKAKGEQIDNRIGFSGSGTMQARPFRLDGSLLSPNQTISGGENRLIVHAYADRSQLAITGTLPGATQLVGSHLQLASRGYNLANLFNFLGVAIPETRAYTINSALTYDGSNWKFTGLKGRFGDSDIGGSLNIGMPEDRLHIGANLKTRSLDMIDAAPFIGYAPDRLDKQGAAATVVKEAGRPRLLPDAPLRISAIGRFDAEVRWHVDQVKNQNLPVSDIDVVVGLDHALLTLKPLTANVAGGKLTANVTLDARKPAVQTDYDIRLSPTPMGKLLARFGVDESGTSGTISARIKMTGTGDSVRDSLAHSNGRIAIMIPAGTFWTRNIQLAELDLGTFVQKMFQDKLKKPVQINCGLIGFTVRSGVAAADPVIIDTTKNVIIARGGFSFRSEAIDMAVRADAKTVSLFSAQSPIGVGGYFAAPSVNVISPDLLARAGVGIGAAVLATPLAGILAFVDPGDAKSTACGPVLSGARASAMRTTKGKPRDDVGNGTPSKNENGKQSKNQKKSQAKKFLGIF